MAYWQVEGRGHIKGQSGGKLILWYILPQYSEINTHVLFLTQLSVVNYTHPLPSIPAHCRQYTINYHINDIINQWHEIG